MSLAEIKDAVTELTPQELAELAAFIQTQDSLARERCETALLSEPALAEDWNRPEEDAAWVHLQQSR